MNCSLFQLVNIGPIYVIFDGIPFTASQYSPLYINYVHLLKPDTDAVDVPVK